MIEKIKKINRGLLELWLGILFTGLMCQLIGMWFAGDKLLYTAALWLGIVLALLMVYHMYRNLDKALDMGVNAQKSATIGNLVRYVCFVIVFAIIAVTKVLNPLVAFMGLMSAKVAAYLQPITHKICNKIFHEVDPIPESLPEEEYSDFDQESDRFLQQYKLRR
ncbi:MAG: ATP synthase subunit I [Lachnospiraceae bacterium]|nr:ATP synthase subunit I [Lachnospiraceae bacterium]MBQ7777019.1 ATP synthase subunit I [Lachnospiraceae bacterium]